VNRGTYLPSCDKHPGDSSFVDVQRASVHFTAFNPEGRCSEFGFDFISLVTSGPGRALGLFVWIHKAVNHFLRPAATKDNDR